MIAFKVHNKSFWLFGFQYHQNINTVSYQLMLGKIIQKERVRSQDSIWELNQNIHQITENNIALYRHRQIPSLQRSSSQLYYILMMWNYQNPMTHPFLPFYNPFWPFHVPPYPPTGLSSQYLPERSWNQDPSNRKLDGNTKIQEQINTKPPKSPQIQPTKKPQKHRPIRRNKRQESFDRKRQKKDRNLPSNIGRFFFSFLYQTSSPLKIMGIQSQRSEEILKSCVFQAREYIKDNQNYVRPGIVEKMCKGELLGVQETSLFRTLFKRFVKVELKLIVSMMKKLRKKEKLTYFRLANRFLKKFMSHK